MHIKLLVYALKMPNIIFITIFFTMSFIVAGAAVIFSGGVGRKGLFDIF